MNIDWRLFEVDGEDHKAFTTVENDGQAGFQTRISRPARRRAR